MIVVLGMHLIRLWFFIEIYISLEVFLYLQFGRAFGLVLEFSQELENDLIVGQLLLFGFLLLFMVVG